MYQADIIADSVNECGNRLTTFRLVYPRIIHAEMLRHRTMSRSVSSSRAIPAKRMIEAVENDMYVPTDWRMNEAGMQGWTKATGTIRDDAIYIWLSAATDAIRSAEKLAALGIHKQHVNRLLEPFAWTVEVVSATEWRNFFALRTAPDADPAIQQIAMMMADAYVSHEPRLKRAGAWHLPFVDESTLMIDTSGDRPVSVEREVSAARCARTSYTLRDGKQSDANSDFALFSKLTSSGHWSPLEHPAMALAEPVRSGNFVGWQQLRKCFENESNGDYA